MNLKTSMKKLSMKDAEHEHTQHNQLFVFTNDLG